MVSVSGFSQYTSLPARQASIDHRRVPVVGRADRHHVDVRCGPAACDSPRTDSALPPNWLAGLLRDLPVHVADRHHVAVRQGLLGDHRALVSHADGADAEAVVLATLGRLASSASAVKKYGVTTPAAASPVALWRNMRRVAVCPATIVLPDILGWRQLSGGCPVRLPSPVRH